MTDESPSVVRWLVGANGLEAVARVTAALRSRRDELSIGESLRTEGLDAPRASAVLAAAIARMRGAGDEFVFTREAFEQASPQLASAWRARRFEGQDRVIDLCCGAGADSIELAKTAGSVVSVDRSEARALLARHNRGPGADVVVADVLRPPLSLRTTVHADPGRRARGRRAHRVVEYEPPLPLLLSALTGTPGACVLVAPGIDFDDASIPLAAELEFVQIGSNLVECAMWLGDLRRASATATMLPSEDSISRHEEPPRLPVTRMGEFLLEPLPAVVRARVHESIEPNARRIAERRALLTLSRPSRSPWFRSWRVEADLPFRARTGKEWLHKSEPLEIEISMHGIRTSVEQVWSDFGRPQRGPNGRRAFIVRLDDGARVYMCVPA